MDLIQSLRRGTHHTHRTTGPILYVLLMLGGAGCDSGGPPKSMRADAIYFGGPIVTMNDDQPTAEAVAVKDGKIVAVGFDAEIERLHKGRKTQMVDLAGRTLIPGFFDAHSHFFQVGLQSLTANLLPPPDGPVRSIPQLQKVLREYIAASPTVKQYGVVIGFGYDDSQLAERRSPTRQELDAVSSDLPVVIVHQSGHLGVYNSKALALAGITYGAQNPAGGVIRREADGKQPNGVLEENAHVNAILKLSPKFTTEQGRQLVEAAEDQYAANGFTTAQEGRADPAALALLLAVAKAERLKIDVVVYPDLVMNADNPILHGSWMSHNYSNGLRLGGVKLVLDGSPQGKTAWFTKPYFQAPSGQPESYRGYSLFTDEQALTWVVKAYQNNWQLLIHANGDAAIDQLIRSVESADVAIPGKDRRTVLVHGQYLRADQVARVKALGIFPALFPLHTFYWGDWHRQSVAGPERAENISPTGWMVVHGITFSIHSDAPVTRLNSIRVLASAVNRTTRSGYVLGPQQRLDPSDALKAMTLWAAYQHFEENTKGSIEVGKNADLVILSDNPVTMPRSKLMELKVLETVKYGKSIYKVSEKPSIK